MATPSLYKLQLAVVALFADRPAALGFYQSTVHEAPAVDEIGVVGAYVVFHPSPGDSSSGSFNRRAGQLMWSFHLMAAGGDPNYVAFAVDQIRSRVDGKTLSVEGIKVGLMQPPFGAQPAPVLVNNAIKPPRLSCSLEYHVLAVPGTADPAPVVVEDPDDPGTFILLEDPDDPGTFVGRTT